MSFTDFGVQNNQNNFATYFKFKKIELWKNKYGDLYQEGDNKANFKPLKEPAITKYNKEKQIEEFVSQRFKGELWEVKVGEEKEVIGKKDGKKYKVQDLLLHFHKRAEDGKLERAILTTSLDSSVSEKLIEKLLGVEDFSEVSIFAGRYSVKKDGQPTGEFRDYISIFAGDKKMEKNIGFKPKDAKYHTPAIILPDIVFDEIKDKNGKVVDRSVNKQWDFEKKQIFREALEKIIEKVDKYREANPKEDWEDRHFVDILFEKKEEGEKGKKNPNTPDINVDDLNIQMPF